MEKCGSAMRSGIHLQSETEDCWIIQINLYYIILLKMDPKAENLASDALSIPSHCLL